MSSKRDQIIETTCKLIETQGYRATGLNQILAESGTPKGSLYHYFPDGKDGLVAAAISHTSTLIEKRLQEGMDVSPDPAVAIPEFLRNLAHYVQASDYQAGGPITAVALEAASTNERLNAACRDAYRAWQAVIETKLLAAGYETNRARRLAALVIALIEGAIILCRSERHIGPLLDTATELVQLL
ncbi:MAG: TetR/AcrR family transcriptional regulator [Chloroflexi bacterium]|nr:MAG: TetR/AcrR family transcriptional regulator [Chloroflexota bacterium]